MTPLVMTIHLKKQNYKLNVAGSVIIQFLQTDQNNFKQNILVQKLISIKLVCFIFMFQVQSVYTLYTAVFQSLP